MLIEPTDDPFARLRTAYDVPDGFPPAVLDAAARAAARSYGDGRADRTAMAFVTLDPAGSTDLDQALHVERAGRDLVLHYAIADVGWFVRRGDEIDAEAWRRGTTIYLPGARVPLHPPVLSEGAASLLPDGPRPAVVFTVRVDEDGVARLDGAERAVVRSRAQLAYETVRPGDLPDGFADLAARVGRAERARGATRVEFPEQQVARRDGRWEVRFRPRSLAEEQNAAMSLAANLAIADVMLASGVGLFRVMPPPDDHAIGRLRHSARAFELVWPPERSLDEFERDLDPADPRTVAFLMAVRRAGGRASYAAFDASVDPTPPWHDAIAATYAHATAPLRRLGDRFVIEAVLALVGGGVVDDGLRTAFAALPAVMAEADGRSNTIDRLVVDIAEALVLQGREGEVFDAVVVDEDDRGVQIQVASPAVMARVEAHRVEPGDEVRVRLVRADPAGPSLAFERVG
jgi:exoribonuclease R